MHTIWKIGLGICVPLAVYGATRQTAHEPPVAKPSWTSAQVAGDYYFGDGLGVNCTLHLSKDSTFAFKWTGCLGTYDQNGGPFHFEGDEVVLQPKSKNDRLGFRGTATRFYPVPWGNRMYLIAEEDMLGFCTAIADGWDGSQVLGMHGDHYIREGVSDERLRKPAQGKPTVPAKYLPWTKQKLVIHVTKIDGKKYFIDRGSEDGIVQGIKLVGYGCAFDYLSVDTVSAHNAIGHLDNMQKNVAPKVGSKLLGFDLELVH